MRCDVGVRRLALTRRGTARATGHPTRRGAGVLVHSDGGRLPRPRHDCNARQPDATRRSPASGFGAARAWRSRRRTDPATPATDPGGRRLGVRPRPPMRAPTQSGAAERGRWSMGPDPAMDRSPGQCMELAWRDVGLARGRRIRLVAAAARHGVQGDRPVSCAAPARCDGCRGPARRWACRRG
ncbi:hypothetical protein SEVIR_1G278966v4 [Setaria viridis]